MLGWICDHVGTGTLVPIGVEAEMELLGATILNLGSLAEIVCPQERFI